MLESVSGLNMHLSGHCWRATRFWLPAGSVIRFLFLGVTRVLVYGKRFEVIIGYFGGKSEVLSLDFESKGILN